MKKLLSFFLNDAPLLWMIPVVLLLTGAAIPAEKALSLPVEFLILLGALAVFYAAFVVLRGAVLRRRFLSRLRRICKERGYVLETRKGGNLQLVIRTEVHTYSCAVVGSLCYRVPVLLWEQGHAYARVHGIRTPGVSEARYGLRVQSVTARVKNDYLFAVAPKKEILFPDDSVRRILIVNPCPRRVLCGTIKNFAYVPSGETVSDYLVFSGGAFCRMLECQGDVFSPDFARRGEL